jgi:hypothetical protein
MPIETKDIKTASALYCFIFAFGKNKFFKWHPTRSKKFSTPFKGKGRIPEDQLFSVGLVAATFGPDEKKIATKQSASFVTPTSEEPMESMAEFLNHPWI